MYIIKLVRVHKSKQSLLLIYNHFMINRLKQSILSILYGIYLNLNDIINTYIVYIVYDYQLNEVSYSYD